jgi:S1-C subfamily serine protease
MRLYSAIFALVLLAGTQCAAESETPRSRPGSVSYIGVYVRDVSAARMAGLKLNQERGAEITMVDHDAPAGKAGLKEQDVILSFNGASVENAQQLRTLIRDTPSGSTASLGISRNGQPVTISVQLAARDPNSQKASREVRYEAAPAGGYPDIPAFSLLQYSRRSGLMVEDLTQQLGDYFGAKNGQGVLVRSVEKGSGADRAGFKAGDVILHAAEDRIGNSGDWNRLMHHNAGQTISIVLLRDHKEQTLSLQVPGHAR